MYFLVLKFQIMLNKANRFTSGFSVARKQVKTLFEIKTCFIASKDGAKSSHLQYTVLSSSEFRMRKKGEEWIQVKLTHSFPVVVTVPSLLICPKPLTSFQSRDRVDSYSLLHIFHCICEGTETGATQTNIFTDSFKTPVILT